MSTVVLGWSCQVCWDNVDHDNRDHHDRHDRHDRLESMTMMLIMIIMIVPGGIDANSTMISSVEFWDAATGRWAIWEELYFFHALVNLRSIVSKITEHWKRKRLKGTIRRIVIIVWPMSLWAFMIIFWETGNSHYIPPHHCDHCDHQVGDDAKTSERKKRSQDGRDERKVDGW